MEKGQTNATWVAAVYRQSVKMLVEQKWDAVKLDGCSQFHNTSLWANLMEQAGRPIAIENCHNEVRCSRHVEGRVQASVRLRATLH
jgi:NAD-dependent oxidoreductase involved in siderophore biosynthesis